MKKFIYVIVAVFVVTMGFGIFFSCKKEFENNKLENKIKLHKSNSYYNQELIQMLMGDPIIDQLTDVINSFDIQQQNGILGFKNENDVNAVYDTLIYFSNIFEDKMIEDPDYQIYSETDSFPDYPILFAFEVILNFISLNSVIENQLLELEAGEGIPLEGDPDNHFIVSNYLRALLSPDCEIIIGKWIFLYGKDYNLKIPDLDFDKLFQTKVLWNDYGEEQGTYLALQKCYAEINDFVKSTNNSCDTCCEVIFYAHLTEPISCPRTYTFSPVITCMCNLSCIKRYYWSFGDGSYSDKMWPEHTYSSSGTYTVKLIITKINNDTCSYTMVLDVSDCIVTICNPSYSEVPNGVRYHFSATYGHCDNLVPISYYWTFGDDYGNTSTSSTPDHIYLYNGIYYVSLTVVFSDQCTSTSHYKINVKDSPNCCKNFSSDKNKNITLAGNYFLNHYFSTYNIFPFHRIVVKSVHKKKNSNNKYKRIDAYQLWVSFGGNIKYTSQNKYCQPRTDIFPQGLNKYKAKSINYDYGVGEAYRVGKEEIWSKYFVLSTSSSSQYQDNNAIALHNRDCN